MPDHSTDEQVEILADEDRPGGYLLLSDRVRQSYVNVNDPTHLEYPYVAALADLIDALPPGPLDVLHLGGGAGIWPGMWPTLGPGRVRRWSRCSRRWWS